MSQALPLRRTAFAALTLTASFGLGGCASLESAWPFGRGDSAKGPQIIALEQDPTVWCYRTLGQPDCYATEQPHYASRLVGAFVSSGGERVPAKVSAEAKTAPPPTAPAAVVPAPVPTQPVAN